jgi:diguanylate cyclase (GGDEF)-like protein
VRTWFLGARRARNVALLVVWAACVGAPAVMLAQSQARNTHSVEQRFGLRASITASFASAFVQERIDRRSGPMAAHLSEAETLKAVAPLGRYLDNVVTLAGAGTYIVDSSGMVIASNGPGHASSSSLRAIDPALARAAEHSSEGSLESRANGESWFASRRIAGTPWRVVITAPTRLLFQAIRGPAQWVPWIVFVAFGILGLGTVAMFDRLISSRARLTRLNRELARVARIDSLTEIHNRRHVEEALRAALGSARRHGSNLALLIVDIDRFKQFNDSHGHLAGDRALRSVAAGLEHSLRLEDVLGRWGGEEFIVVLPGADAECAAMVAERLRARIAASDIDLPGQAPCRLTVTIGIACWVGQDAEDLINQADTALYAGKADGRNLVKLFRDEADPLDVRAGEMARIGEPSRSSV